MKLMRWLHAHESKIAERWYLELMAGAGSHLEDGAGLLKTMVDFMVSFIPPCFGDRREVAMEVWEQAAHLYGSLAVRRGLAAGEVVDELQLLRRVILRLFLVDAPSSASGEDPTEGIPPLDLLALNRILDLGVSRASIAYVDDLFFAHLQGSGVPEGITRELMEETERQLRGFRKELEP
ncbi:MAG: hypothetical protein ACWGSQ_16605 [Longimicrobiales bacterium]